MSVADFLVIAAYSGGAALAVAVIGLALLRAIRRRALLLSVVVVALGSVAAVLAGALAAAEAMFLSAHDLRVLLVIVAVAGSVGSITAVVLGRGVVSGAHALGRAAAGLSDGTYRSPSIPLSAELASLDGQLSEMSVRLQNGRQRERDLEASRRELVAWISHDLRTPLAGIRAMSEALEDGVVQDAATVDRYHSGIRREADRLSAMVDDLFELSRINASVLQLDLQELALGDLISDAVATALPVALAQGVTIQAQVEPDLPAVAGSAPELGRVLANLVSNAVRYTPRGGTVEITAANDNEQVVLAVQDGCGGIPQDDLPRVFDVAFRGTSARTPGQEGGAGLGLAIARGLVEAHAGTIAIDNAGAGCCVRVALAALRPGQSELADLARAFRRHSKAGSHPTPVAGRSRIESGPATASSGPDSTLSTGTPTPATPSHRHSSAD